MKEIVLGSSAHDAQWVKLNPDSISFKEWNLVQLKVFLFNQRKSTLLATLGAAQRRWPPAADYSTSRPSRPDNSPHHRIHSRAAPAAFGSRRHTCVASISYRGTRPRRVDTALYHRSAPLPRYTCPICGRRTYRRRNLLKRVLKS